MNLSKQMWSGLLTLGVLAAVVIAAFAIGSSSGGDSARHEVATLDGPAIEQAQPAGLEPQQPIDGAPGTATARSPAVTSGSDITTSASLKESEGAPEEGICLDDIIWVEDDDPEQVARLERARQMEAVILVWADAHPSEKFAFDYQDRALRHDTKRSRFTALSPDEVSDLERGSPLKIESDVRSFIKDPPDDSIWVLQRLNGKIVRTYRLPASVEGRDLEGNIRTVQLSEFLDLKRALVMGDDPEAFTQERIDQLDPPQNK